MSARDRLVQVGGAQGAVVGAVLLVAPVAQPVQLVTFGVHTTDRAREDIAH